MDGREWLVDGRRRLAAVAQDLDDHSRRPADQHKAEKLEKTLCYSHFMRGKVPSCCICAASKEGNLGGIDLLAIVAAGEEVRIDIHRHDD